MAPSRFDITAPNVPLVGQPYKLNNWFSVVVITCNMCDKGQVITLVGAAPVECPHCHTAYQCAILNFDLNQPPEATVVSLLVAKAVGKGGDS